MSGSNGRASGFTCKVFLLLALLLADLVLSGLADFGGGARGDAATLTSYAFVGAQLAVQLFVLLVLFLLFFGTYLFQVGLVSVVVREFAATLWVVAGYFAVFAAYAAVKLTGIAAAGPDGLWASPLFVLFSVLQKLAACGYYLALLRAAVRLGEAKYYTKGPWVKSVVMT
jgi:hypothetical protein